VKDAAMADGSRFDEALRFEAELRFAKQQQWYVATASVTLIAAAYAVLKGSYLGDYEALGAIVFIIFIAGAGITVLVQHKCARTPLRKKRCADFGVTRPRKPLPPTAFL
jgi:hypothetical protein